MDEHLRGELRDYAWKYYALHAEQRIKTFNFFLILYALAVGGVTAAVKDLQSQSVAAGIGFLMAFVAFIFWKLDVRNKQLIQHAEAALKELENDPRLEDKGPRPHRLKLFQREDVDT